MTTIALLGIPVVTSSDSDGYPISLSVSRGATNQPRKDLEQLLTQSSYTIKVSDLGELVPTANTAFGINFTQLGSLAKDTVGKSDADVVLVVGGNHAAALPLCHLPGHVVRADAHGDAYVLNSPMLNYAVSGGTYMHFVKEMGLKTSGEVLNVGVKYTNAQSPNGGAFGKLVSTAQLLNHQKPPQTTLFDIDLDVLHEGYRLPHGHSTSDLTAEDLSALIISLKPKVIGMFECVNRYGAIPEGIVSVHQNIFSPICKAVAEAAVARAAAATNNANPTNQIRQQTHQASSATYR